MKTILDVLKSDTFWTAFGSIATAAGVLWVIYKEAWTKRPRPEEVVEGRAQDESGGTTPRGRLTNRDKIRSCLTAHPEGATLEQIASETGIPIGSLSSDMAGREAMGIDKDGYGRTAIYRLKSTA